MIIIIIWTVYSIPYLFNKLNEGIDCPYAVSLTAFLRVYGFEKQGKSVYTD